MKHNILSILIDEILNKNKSRGVKVYVQIITTRYFSREWLSKSERISFSPFFFFRQFVPASSHTVEVHGQAD